MENQEAKPVGTWTKIDLKNRDSWPEQGVRVLIYDANPKIVNAARKQVAILLDPDKYLKPVFMLDQKTTVVKTATYWQPLPDDPIEYRKKEGKENDEVVDDPFS